ncbi:MAG: site-specific integrase [Nitrospirae bacterium]|nr:site-specific integrase [Nitrospirota bacterium]
MGLYKRKGSQFYWVSFKLPSGRKILESTKTTNKKLAERIHAKRLMDIQEGRWFETNYKKKPLKEMIERYRTEYTDSKGYYQKARDKSIFKHLYAYFGEDASLSNVEERVGGYEHYRKAESAQTATILKELGLLRRMFNIARKQWKWKIANPVSDIELPKVRNERVRYLSEDEYTNLLQALEASEQKWLKPLVIIAMDTGLRLSNICDLKWSEVNLFSKMITMDAEAMKNDDYLGVPLTDRIFQVFKELRKTQSLSGYVFHDNGKKLYDRKVQRAFRGALKEAKIGNFHFHDLRHTFASYLRQKGVDLHAISTLLGHKDLRMTKRYAHLNVDSLRRAVSVLEVKTGYILATVEGERETVCSVTP